MKIHNITKDDMLNGDGLRVVVWVSGCEHHCPGCQNPITWDKNDGEEITTEDMFEIYKELCNDYVSGITFSGGDPLHPDNRDSILFMCKWLRGEFGHKKTIWLYTGYNWEDVNDLEIMQYIDVLVDGRFIKELADINYHWAGSTNQRVIDVPATLMKGKIVFHEEKAISESDERQVQASCCGC